MLAASVDYISAADSVHPGTPSVMLAVVLAASFLLVKQSILFAIRTLQNGRQSSIPESKQIKSVTATCFCSRQLLSGVRVCQVLRSLVIGSRVVFPVVFPVSLTVCMSSCATHCQYIHCLCEIIKTES